MTLPTALSDKCSSHQVPQQPGPTNQMPSKRTEPFGSGSQVIQLDARNEDGMVTVVPDNQDRFNLKVGEAVAACLRAEQDKQAGARFELLLKRLAEWTLGREDVEAAFITTRDRGFAFVVVHKTSEYDREYEDALAALQLELSRDLDIRLPVEVVSLPPASAEAIQSFLNENLTMRFRGGER